MKWIEKFDLFLFDFDGLLVDTENIHYEAFILMLERRGFQCNWSFSYYCSVAHQTMEGLNEVTYATYPQLKEQEPNWKILHEEKKKIYEDLLHTAKIVLMPGVEKLLSSLEKKHIKQCVVTNSKKSQVELIQAMQPKLRTIPYWITREEYIEPKPSPEGYLRAISLYGKKCRSIIGFEDTIRGIRALMKTPATPVLIRSSFPKEFDALLSENILHFTSFDEIAEEGLYSVAKEQ